MPMSRNALDLWHMLVPLAQSGIIFQLLPLSRRLDARSLRRARAPESNVAIVGAGENVGVVRGPAGAEDALHALGVINIAAVAVGTTPESDAAVVAGGDKLLTGRREFDIHHRGDMIFQDVERPGEVARIEEVNVMVLVCNGEVERLHGIPCERVGGESEGGAVGGSGGAQVIKGEGAVRSAGGEKGCLALVEGEGGDGVDSGGPGEGLRRGRAGAGEIVDLDGGGGCGGEGGFGAVTRDTGERIRTQPGGRRGGVGGGLVGVIELDRLVGAAGEQLAIMRPTHPAHHVFVRAHLPYLVAAGQVPHLEHAVAAPASEAIQRLRISCKRIHSVHVTPPELGDERSSEHAVQLRGIQRPRVLPRPLERVQRRIEISWLPGHIAARRLVCAGCARERFDLLHHPLTKPFIDRRRTGKDLPYRRPVAARINSGGWRK